MSESEIKGGRRGVHMRNGGKRGGREMVSGEWMSSERKRMRGESGWGVGGCSHGGEGETERNGSL